MTDVRMPVIGTVAVALAIGAVAWVIGVSGIQSVFLATGVLTLGAGRIILSLHETARSHDQWMEHAVPTPDGTRREVLELSWSLTGRRGTVTPTATRRLHALARRRLARHGVDLDDPDHAAAAERLLGSRAHLVVTTPPGRPIRYRAFTRAVTAVERLEDLRTSVPVASPHAIREQRP